MCVCVYIYIYIYIYQINTCISSAAIPGGSYIYKEKNGIIKMQNIIQCRMIYYSTKNNKICSNNCMCDI